VFGAERLTGALLDLAHPTHVHILGDDGDSYRLAHSKRRAAGIEHTLPRMPTHAD